MNKEKLSHPGIIVILFCIALLVSFNVGMKYQTQKDSIVVPSNQTLEQNASEKNTVLFSESGISVSLPEQYTPKDYKNPYFSSQEAIFFYEHTDSIEVPFLAFIEVNTPDSIQNYIDTSESEDLKTRRADGLTKFNEEMDAFYAKQSTDSHEFTNIKGIPFHFDTDRNCQGDIYGCRLLRHHTYIDETRISFSIVYRNDENIATDEEIKELLSQFTIEKF
jgi:hypothetical protein